MRTIIQRVSSAHVQVDKKTIGRINHGFMLLLGVEEEDTLDDVKWLTQKLCKLRLFNDADGKMNLNIKEVGGNILVISQFTLHAKTKKGNRPSYIKAARPEKANHLYENFIDSLFHLLDQPIQSGEFGAHMEITQTNDGPITLYIDTKNKE
ncbi:MAG: D-tyrosyl-tRNA(Tyr) deacylase [Salibacteraceae bacterium]|jgi:D-tyrosyl-tRNA(Tyr) deacylase